MTDDLDRRYEELKQKKIRELEAIEKKKETDKATSEWGEATGRMGCLVIKVFWGCVFLLFILSFCSFLLA